MKPRHLDLLENFERLPLSATLPIPVAAAFLGLSEKTIRRYFPLTFVSDGRRGVRKSDLLKSRKEVAAATSAPAITATP
jgi:hypothetical protein